MWEAFLSFMLERSQSQFQFTQKLQELFYYSAKEVLGDREPEIILALELDGEVWTLVVVDDAAVLHRVENDVAETHFLGRLRGKYVETVKFVENGIFEFTYRVTDERLPGKELALTTRQLKPYADVRPATRARLDAIENLRTKLREWAASPE